MSWQYSDGLRNMLGAGCSWQELFNGGEIQLYSGTPPTDVNAAKSGTLLAVLTAAGAARTAETSATGTITFSGGAGGDTCTSITIDSYEILGATVNWTTSDAATAALVASQINRYSRSVIKVVASVSGAVVTVKVTPGQGTGLNGKTLACTVAGGAFAASINGGASAAIGGAGATAGVDWVSGIAFDEILSAAMGKYGTISGTVLATGTVGYVRIEGVTTPTGTSVSDTTNKQYFRIQGTVGTSGADYNMNSTAVTAGATTDITDGDFTVPATE
jgi:hypothetical protein